MDVVSIRARWERKHGSVEGEAQKPAPAPISAACRYCAWCCTNSRVRVISTSSPDQQGAVVERFVPDQAEVLAVDGGTRLGAHAQVVAELHRLNVKVPSSTTRW